MTCRPCTSPLPDSSNARWSKPLPARYTLLETIRAYAHAELTHAAEVPTMARRHAQHYLTVIAGAQRGLQRCDPQTLHAIATELDNLRAADAWARAHDQRLQAELAAALREFWWAARRPHEGLQWTEAALAASEQHPDRRVRAQLLLARAQLVRLAGRISTTQGERDARAALALCEELEDHAGAVRSLIILGWEATGRDDRQLGAALADRALALARRLDDDLLIGLSLWVKVSGTNHVSDVVDIARAGATHLRRAGATRWRAHFLASAGYRALVHADYDIADELFSDAMQAARSSDDAWTLIIALGNLGVTALFRERFDDAHAAFEQQLALVEAGPEWARRLVIAEPLIGLAAIAAVGGDHTQATLLAERARTHEGPLHPDERIVSRRLRRRFLDPSRQVKQAPPA